MFKGNTVHLRPTAKVGIYRIKPTKATYAKTFAPLVVFWVLLGLASAVLNKKAEEDWNNHVNSVPTEDETN